MFCEKRKITLNGDLAKIGHTYFFLCPFTFDFRLLAEDKFAIYLLFYTGHVCIITMQ